MKALLKTCEDTLEKMVEVEFAMTLDERRGRPARFGFLQVRPMVVSEAAVDLRPEELSGKNVLAASAAALGNGLLENIRDIVFVKPEKFNVHHSATVASELELLNHRLRGSDCPYLLIGFGRWGTSDPQAGIPVNFGQISGAKVIIESALPETSAMLSQGSHFFHNITSFQSLLFLAQSGGSIQGRLGLVAGAAGHPGDGLCPACPARRPAQDQGRRPDQPGSHHP